METATDRITRYLLARLRRRAVLDLYGNAADVGLLERYSVDDNEESGTVWTIADHTRRSLTGDEDKDNKLIARRLRTSMTSSSGTSLNRFDYETDQDAVLEAQSSTKSRVKHRAPSPIFAEEREAPPANLTPERPTTMKTKDFMAMVLQNVPAPNVAQVTVALLAARAVGTITQDVSALYRLMSRPNTFALIKAPVAGFERRFTQMLEDGLLLPYRVRVGDVYHGASLRDQHHGEQRKKLPRRPVKLLSGNRARHVEHAVLSRHLSDALLDGSVPIIVVDETLFAPPSSLSLTADVVFECTGLDHVLLAELLFVTLGIAPTLSLKRMNAIALNLEHLSIDDLTLAIRPTHDLDTILSTLATLGDRARNGDDDDEDNAKGRDSHHGRSGRESTSKSGKGTSGGTGKTPLSLDGTEIIQPVKPTLVKTAADTDVGAGSSPRTAPESHLQHIWIETLSGYGEARQWALDLKDDLRAWRDGELGWSELSTKLLLSGPPGTGKTTYARALCNTLQVPLLVTSVATWLEPGYLGDVLKRMSQAFETARTHAPSILFIDEIDNIGSRSGGRREQYDDYWRSLINRMLELLDGASKTEGVVVVAATNLPDRIDPALLRSGRLEKHVVIPMPDTEALTGILAHHLAADLAGVLSSAPNRAVVKRIRPPKARDHDPNQLRKTADREKARQGKGAPQ